MRVFEKIEAWGHQNITAKNTATFEVTKEKYLTKRGDCIIAVNASKGTRDLSREFKQLAQREHARITVIMEVNGSRDVAVGWGNPRLTFSHPTDLVVRKSSFLCDRTLMINADKAAADLSKDLVTAFQNPMQRIMITVSVEV